MAESSPQETTKKGLSSAKREDVWALLIALVVLAIAFAAPEALHELFKKTLFVF